MINAGRQPADVAIDLAPWGGKLKAADALGGAPAADWAGTAKLAVPAETGRVYQLTH